MTPDQTVQQIKLLFRGLNTVAASTAIPPIASLSDLLNIKVTDAKKSGNTQFTINQSQSTKFATAAVEMWQRAVHSFLISASLTRASPVWSSVCGYYSSHYTIRAFAHLFGNFLLYRLHKCRIKLEINNGAYVCEIHQKNGDREHKLYWKEVKENELFSDNSFYTTNEDVSNISDGSHRNKANYIDHINGFPPFQILDESMIRLRVNAMSTMEIDSAPIPNSDRYPDLDSVQLIAYYRLVNFRIFLDDIILGNRFWSVHRNPNWCPSYFKFQLKSENFVTSHKELIVHYL